MINDERQHLHRAIVRASACRQKIGGLRVAQVSDHLRSIVLDIAIKKTEAKSCKTSNKHPKALGKRELIDYDCEMTTEVETSVRTSV